MPAGRPRTFDPEKALDAALRVFWQKGYEGSSLPDLTKAMNISRPSLYAAFGNKEALFRKAIDRYVEGPAATLKQALDQPNASGVARVFLETTIDVITCPKNPRGCFLVQGALTCGDNGAPLKREAAKRRASGEALLRKRFERAIKERDLPTGTDAANLARYLATIAHGLAIQAASGATRNDLKKVAETALRAMPT